jgi:two-component system response regulator PilR (NtrC family)
VSESQSKTILVADDEQVLRDSIAELLTDEGYEVAQAANGREAHDLLLQRPFDMILSDIRMPEMDGLQLLAHAKQIAPHTPVLIMTAFGTVESAVKAMQQGAHDYLLKPVQFDDLIIKVQRALEYSDIVRTKQIMDDQAAESSTFHNLVGESRSMMKLFDTVKKLSSVKSNVLIVGESGTGKELFARAIHYNGVTKSKPFVAVNCGAIPDTLIESELFGYRRGAFTGAMRDKVGYFEAANGGTLFLDEISTLPIGVQASLLRVLEERTVTPVGDTHPRPINVRIIAASNQNLEEMIKNNEFREDLLFRLNVVKLQLPPLRARREDIPMLVHHFLDKYTKEMNKRVLGLTNGAMRAILNHEWRGNVRELENVMERAVIFAEGREIGVEDMPFSVEGMSDEVGEELKDALAQFERQHILYSLRRHNYDKAETAKHLGIGVSSLYRKLDELNIPKSLGETTSIGPPAT